jgi:hypothetical protein
MKQSKKNINKDIDTEIINININSEKDAATISKKRRMERERELKKGQLPNVPASKRLRPSDIHRIVQHTDNSIFDEEQCALWMGYITNLKNKRKGTYINFYFRDKKKVALHRLLYANFKGYISNKDYIKYSCANKGKCCNINHMVRFEYNSNEKEELEDEESDNEENDEPIEDVFKIIIY